ncbi:unnamed protein product, partial [Mesorhabditis spiculigera]
MASSRGRERIRQRQNAGFSFAFGSSTPRDLSYLNKVPKNLRQYDTKVPREESGGPSLVEYMRQARSLTPSAATKGKWKGREPRSEQRPPVPTMSRSITVDPSRNRSHMPFITRRTQEEEGEREEVSSEPDLVQDREMLNFEEEKRKQDERKAAEAAGRPPRSDSATKRESPHQRKSSPASRPTSKDQKTSTAKPSSPSTPEKSLPSRQRSVEKKSARDRSQSPKVIKVPAAKKEELHPIENNAQEEAVAKAESPKPLAVEEIPSKDTKVTTNIQGEVRASLITTKTQIETQLGEQVTVVEDVATSFPSARGKSKEETVKPIEKEENDEVLVKSHPQSIMKTFRRHESNPLMELLHFPKPKIL